MFYLFVTAIGFCSFSGRDYKQLRFLSTAGCIWRNYWKISLFTYCVFNEGFSCFWKIVRSVCLLIEIKTRKIIGNVPGISSTLFILVGVVICSVYDSYHHHHRLYADILGGAGVEKVWLRCFVFCYGCSAIYTCFFRISWNIALKSLKSCKVIPNDLYWDNA